MRIHSIVTYCTTEEVTLIKPALWHGIHTIETNILLDRRSDRQSLREHRGVTGDGHFTDYFIVVGYCYNLTYFTREKLPRKTTPY